MGDIAFSRAGGKMMRVRDHTGGREGGGGGGGGLRGRLTCAQGTKPLSSQSPVHSSEISSEGDVSSPSP